MRGHHGRRVAGGAGVDDQGKTRRASNRGDGRGGGSSPRSSRPPSTWLLLLECGRRETDGNGRPLRLGGDAAQLAFFARRCERQTDEHGAAKADERRDAVEYVRPALDLRPQVGVRRNHHEIQAARDDPGERLPCLAVRRVRVAVNGSGVNHRTAWTVLQRSAQ